MFRPILAAALVAFGGLSLAAPTIAQRSGIGTTEEAIGIVTGTLGVETRDLDRGSRVSQNETVATGQNSAAVLRLDEGTVLRLGTTSRIVLDRLVHDPRTGSGAVAVRVTRGAFRFASGRLRSEDYEIRTPTATIGVRGTDFSLIVEADGRTTAVLHNGRIIVANAAGVAVTVANPGEATVIVPPGRAGGAPPPPTPPRPVTNLVQGGLGAVERATPSSSLPATGNANSSASSSTTTPQGGTVATIPGDADARSRSADPIAPLSVPQVGASQAATTTIAPADGQMTTAPKPPTLPDQPATTPTMPLDPNRGSAQRTDAFGNTITETWDGTALLRQIAPTAGGSPVNATQLGSGHALSATPGANTPTSILQDGEGHRARVSGGAGGSADIRQAGENAILDLDLGRSSLKTTTRQAGRGNAASITAPGAAGAIGLTQDGIGNTLDLRIEGAAGGFNGTVLQR